MDFPKGVVLLSWAMKLFAGVKFLVWGDKPDYPDWCDRNFSGYYGIQFHRSGPLQFARGKAPLKLIGKPCAFLSVPGTHYRYGAPAGQSRHHAFVDFTGPRIEKYLREGLITPEMTRQPVVLTDQETFSHTVDRLFTCLGADLCYSVPLDMFKRIRQPIPLPDLEMAINLLESLLLQLHRQANQARPEDQSLSAVRGLVEQIRFNPQREWDFEVEARRLNMSRIHLYRLFPRITYCAPGRFLRNCRLARAAQLLKQTNLPIKKIAETCGIPDIYYFSRVFRKYHHTTPNKFRKLF